MKQTKISFLVKKQMLHFRSFLQQTAQTATTEGPCITQLLISQISHQPNIWLMRFLGQNTYVITATFSIFSCIIKIAIIIYSGKKHISQIFLKCFEMKFALGEVPLYIP